MESIYLNQPLKPYRLSMQVLADELEARQLDFQFYNRNDEPQLTGIRFYRPGTLLQRQYVYLLTDADGGGDFRSLENIHFLILGDAEPEQFSFSSSLLLVHHCDALALYNLMQQLFEKYGAWEKALQWALQTENPLEAMLSVSRPILGNPMFLHDADFYILACPDWVEGMLHWEKDPRTGREMVPMELINEFRVDSEYLSTLPAKSVTMFSAALRGYRILFANLWYQERYEGRVCVDELERPLRRSDYLHLAYLTEMVTLCLSRQKLFWRSLGKDTDRFFTEMLEGGALDGQTILDNLRYLGWGLTDTYLILKIATEREESGNITPAGLFGYIEAQIAEGRALLFRKDIAVIVNLTAAGTTTAEVLSSLAYILREGLFKMGVSTELSRFTDLRDGYAQASVALDYGRNSGSMFWSYHFEDYALQFILDSARQQIHPRLLVSGKLRRLQTYDAENNTELYHTLEIYLRLERNVVQTSKALFIHRSTLFYRLDRIRKLVDLNLDSEEERLYLQLSFQLDRLQP